MRLTSEGPDVPDDVSAAMQRGLNAAGQSDALVVVTDDFVGAIRRMDPDSKNYEAERGSGVVAARTVSTRSCEAVIVINAAAALDGDRSADDIERLLAHEAGHVSLHGRSEALSLQSFGKAHPQLVATLHGIAQVAIEEFRIERQLAIRDYPIAERADIDSLEEQLFELSATIFDALWTPDISARQLAEKILSGMHGFTVTLAYLAGREIGCGRDTFTPTQLSTFGQHHWQELVGDSWAARLALYRSIPPADAEYGANQRPDDLRAAVNIERQLLRNLGFGMTMDAANGESFNRTAGDELLTARWGVLATEADRRGGFA